MWKITLREIKHTLGRYLTILAIIALGIGIFVGLKISRPVMVATVQDYVDDRQFYDYELLSTLGLTEDDVAAVAALDDVRTAAGAYSVDVLYTVDEDEYVMKLLSITEGVNESWLVAGRMPEAANECLVDSRLMGEDAIGSTVEIAADNDEDTLDMLRYDSYEVVGVIDNPLYLNFERGTTSLGGGQLTGYAFLPAEAFDSDYYTAIYLKFDEDYEIYSDEYKDYIDAHEDMVDALLEKRVQLRYDSVVADAQAEIDDAESELYDAEDQIADAEQELADARQEVADGEAEIADNVDALTEGESELHDAKKELEDGESELADAIAQLEDGETQLADATQQLEDGESELADAIAQLEDGEAQLAEAKQQLEDGESQLNDAKQQLADGQAELEEQKAAAEAQFAEAKQQLDDAAVEIAENEQALNDGAQQIAAAEAEITENEQRLEDSLKELDAAQEELDAAQAEYDAGVAELEEKIRQFEAIKAFLSSDLIAATEAEIAAAQALLDEAAEQIAAGQAQITAGYQEAEAGQQELAAAKAELTVQKQILKDGQAQLEAGKQELADGQAEYEAQLAEYNAQIADAQAQLDDAAAQINASEQEIADGWAQIESSRQELDDGWAQIESPRQELDDGWAMIVSSRQELDDGWAQVEDSRQTIADGWAQVADSQAEIEDGWAQIADAQQEIADGKQEIADGEAELADSKQEVADGWAEVADAKQELADLTVTRYLLGRDSNVGYVCFESDSMIVDNIAYIFPVFFFLVAMLICITTMNRMVDEGRTQMGVLKALGYGKSAVVMEYVTYSGSAALIGSVVGYALGSTIFPSIIWYAYGIMYNVPHTHLLFKPVWLVLCILVALVCSVGATMLTCYVEFASVPANLMRPRAPKIGKRVFMEYITPIWKHLSFLQKVSVRNVLRYKKRLLMMVLGIGGCMALLLTGLGLRDCCVHIADSQYDKIQTYDIDAVLSDPADEEEIADLPVRFAGEIADMLFLQEDSVDLVTENLTKEVTVVVVQDPDEMDGFWKLFTAKNEDISYPGEGEAVITQKMARKLKLSVGDTVTVRNDDMQTVEVTISAITVNFVYNYIFLSEETYTQGFGSTPEYKHVFMHVQDGADLYESAAAVVDDDDVLQITITQDTRTRLANMMDSLNAVVLMVIICAALLAFIVIYNLTNINIIERVREIATIKVLGFYPGETAQYVFRENIILTVVGAFIGLFLGKGLHWLVMRMIDVDIVSFDIVITVGSYVLAVVLTFVFAAIVDVAMYFKLDHIDMAESLKTIE